MLVQSITVLCLLGSSVTMLYPSEMPGATHLGPKELPTGLSPLTIEINVPTGTTSVVLTAIARHPLAMTSRKFWRKKDTTYRPWNVGGGQEHTPWAARSQLQRKGAAQAWGSAFIEIRSWASGFSGSLFISKFKTQVPVFKAQEEKKQVCSPCGLAWKSIRISKTKKPW